MVVHFILKPETHLVTNLFATITNFEHLLTAYGRARRGKRHKTSVGHYDFHLENKIISLRRELLSGNYKPSPYAHFTIYDPKTRQVSAPAFSDRVLHHSLVAAIEPLFERQFIVDSYVCRVDKGTHFGAQRVKKFLMAART